MQVPVGEDILDAPYFQSYATYEACAPDSRNRTKRLDETNDEHEITFIPYADDPEFNIKAFIRNPYFRWDTLTDPDGEHLGYLSLMILA
jgi:hypothetical protein